MSVPHLEDGVGDDGLGDGGNGWVAALLLLLLLRPVHEGEENLPYYRIYWSLGWRCRLV